MTIDFLTFSLFLVYRLEVFLTFHFYVYSNKDQQSDKLVKWRISNFLIETLWIYNNEFLDLTSFFCKIYKHKFMCYKTFPCSLYFLKFFWHKFYTLIVDDSSINVVICFNNKTTKHVVLLFI